MILKIFTKRKPGGEPLKTNLDWTDSRIESERINTRRIKRTIEATLINSDSIDLVEIDLDTHGYEIYNDNGVMIEKFVTALKKEDMQ